MSVGHYEEDDALEFGFHEFADRLGLPQNATVTGIGMVWFDLKYGSGSNKVRVRYRVDRASALTPLKLVSPPLEDRLRRLVAKWRSQARHPMRRSKPEERELLDKHADELMAELGAPVFPEGKENDSAD